MGIFRKQEIDLSDEGLAMAAAENNDADTDTDMAAAGPAGPKGEEWTEQEQQEQLYREQNGQQQEQPQQDSSADPSVIAEREAVWRRAVDNITASWPQAAGQGQALIAKMNEIGARYGDPLLWQRAPEGIMREAAIELFGLPRTKDNTYAKVAAEAARNAAMEEMLRRDKAKAGLAKKKGGSSPAAPPSEEEKIVAEIAKARDHRIF